MLYSLETNNIKNAIINGKTSLGIELGSTRIKAVLIDEKNTPIASGSLTGKIAIVTICGLTVWMKSGKGYKTAIKNGYRC